MSQSLVKNYMHLVFSTKDRIRLINPPFEQELHRYLAGICKGLNCHPLKVGGYSDHVHIFCTLSKNIPLVKLMEELKSHSSKWMKTRASALANFFWQTGYGAFSVSASQADALTEYINNQYQHHQTFSFQDEFKAFLRKYKVDFDERFIWK